MIAVCLNAYNEETNLGRIVHRIAEQDCPELTEILIVDDGSTDDTPNISKQLESKFEKVRVIRQENKGLGGARNTSIANAKGTYISFIDCDDDISDDYLATITANLDDTSDIFSFSYNRIDKKGRVSQIDPISEQETPFWASCYRLDYLRDHNFTFVEKSIYEDNGLIPFIFRKTSARKLINTPIYRYIYVEGSLSNRKTLGNVYGRINSTKEYLKNAQKYGIEITDRDYSEKISNWFEDAMVSSFCREGTYQVLKEVINYYTSLDSRSAKYLSKKGSFVLKVISKYGYAGYIFLVITKLSRKLK
ncbi:glycosyltransferase [Vibrio barjaei]|uniref:glycosyltransferase n=1 Tax=Vibrio barjaei TaxID=1676683 RepID=UPI0022850791|nr:glycosyltransferase [Vibrio barjaei]MCY9872527.1 glycosyltransferase [Vibrio barjaei]